VGEVASANDDCVFTDVVITRAWLISSVMMVPCGRGSLGTTPGWGVVAPAG